MYFTQLIVVTQEVSVQPDGSICPNESYWCRANLVTSIVIDNTDLSDPFTYSDIVMRLEVTKDGAKVLFTEIGLENGLANLTAQLLIVDIPKWNGSNFSCRASGGNNKNISVCIIGKQFR